MFTISQVADQRDAIHLEINVIIINMKKQLFSQSESIYGSIYLYIVVQLGPMNGLCLSL